LRNIANTSREKHAGPHLLIHPPISSYSEKLETFTDARRREAQVKRWTRAKKEALISGEIQKLKLLSKSKQTRKRDTNQ
jgi:hypothetical protein